MSAAPTRRFDEHVNRTERKDFALAFTTVTLRLYIGVDLAVGLPFGLGYLALAWLC